MRSGLSRGALAALAMLVASAGTAAAGVTAVPEPTSFALLAAALGGAALIKLRRRK